MARRKHRKLEPWEIGEVRILAASGLSADEIAQELGLSVGSIVGVYTAERDALANIPDTVLRIYAHYRSLCHRRDRADRELRKFYASLPKQVSGNGAKDSHQWQIGAAIKLERELAQIDAFILRALQQLQEHERQTGGGHAAIPPLNLNINTEERGDFPSRHGEVVDDGGDGDD